MQFRNSLTFAGHSGDRTFKLGSGSIPMRFSSALALVSMLVVSSFLYAVPCSATMIHYYPFTSGATDVVSGANGTLLGGASVVGGELLLDGANDYVQLGEHIIPTSGSYTVALFARQSSPQASYIELISQGLTSGPGFYIGHDPSGFIRVSDSWKDTGVAYPLDGQRHHFAVTVDSDAGNSRLYVDGVLEATLGFAITTTSGGSNTRFGKQFQAIGEQFAGALDDIYIYNRALSPTEVSTLNSPVPEPTTGVLLGLGLLGVAVRRRV